LSQLPAKNEEEEWGGGGGGGGGAGLVPNPTHVFNKTV